MGLKTCKDCGEEISKKAEVCPSCGRVYKKSDVGCLLTILISIIFFMFIVSSN